MKPRRLILPLVLVAIVFIGVAAWETLRPSGPVYHGRHLSQWARALGSNRTKTSRAACNEIREMGTNALPLLLKLASQRESSFSRFKQNVVGWLDTHQSYLSFDTSEFRMRSKVDDLFREYFVTAKIPDLIALLAEDDSGPIAGQLIAIGNEAIEPMLDALTNGNPAIRTGVIFPLLNLCQLPPMYQGRSTALLTSKVQKGLTNCLADADERVRVRAAFALTVLGTNADLASPVLVNALNHRDELMRSMASDGLSRISRGAAPVTRP